MKTLRDLKRGPSGEEGQYRFFVPSYQRGYRWGKEEVTALLNDLRQYRHDCTDNYCLQPIIVKRRTDGQFEVIDGQQRLTTLYIINQYIDRHNEAPLYEIEYETRPTSKTFLKKMRDFYKQDSKDIPITNPDYYYMRDAYYTAMGWMEENVGDLLDCRDFWGSVTKHVEVIWYEIDGAGDDCDEGSIDLFRKINVGKIPLTNAELVKGLIIAQIPKDQQERRLFLASEWALMENRLQDDGLWYFLTDGSRERYRTRIDLVFDIWAKTHGIAIGEDGKRGRYAVFSYLYSQVESDSSDTGNTLAEMWDECKTIFANLEYWYENKEIYHLLGYLIARRQKSGARDELLTLYSSLSECDKSSMRQALREEIRKSVMNNVGEKRNLEKADTELTNVIADLSYEQGDQVRNILLLFNILTIVQSKGSAMRFPFDLYKQESWDIEHIHATAGGPPTDKEVGKLEDDSDRKDAIKPDESRRVFMDGVLKLLQDADAHSNIIDDVRHFIEAGDFSEETSSQFWRVHQSAIDGEMEDQNSIGNLTLLNSRVNRQYGAASFLEKRRTIIREDRGMSFIPPATKNVFLKYYTGKPENFDIWGHEDRHDYLYGEYGILKVIGQYFEETESQES